MEATSQERGLDPLELKAWRGLLETTARLRRHADQLLFVDSGLSGSDYSVLVTLHELGEESLRVSALAERLGWEQSRLSHHLARMEARGLVSRHRHAEDRRGFEVVITPHGREIFLAAATGHSRAVVAHFAEVLSVTQLEALADVMDTLADHLALTTPT